MATQGVSYIDPVTGQPAQGATAPAGVKFRDSALLQNGGLNTAQGDVFNAFRGYQSSAGGGFGGAFDDKPEADRSTWAGVARNDPASIQAALASNDPALKAAGRSYYLGRGSQGFTGSDADYAKAASQQDAQRRLQSGSGQEQDLFDSQGWGAPDIAMYRAEQARQLTAQSDPSGPAVDADPFGRFDAPTAANRVIKPADEARLAAQAMDVRQPRVDTPTLRPPMQVPSDATPDPFATFTGTPTPPQPTPTVPGATVGAGGLPPGTEQVPPPIPEGPGFLGPPANGVQAFGGGITTTYGQDSPVAAIDGPGQAMPRPGIRPIKPISGAGSPPLRPASGMFPGLKPPQMRPIGPKPAGGAPAPVPSY